MSNDQSSDRLKKFIDKNISEGSLKKPTNEWTHIINRIDQEDSAKASWLFGKWSFAGFIPIAALVIFLLMNTKSQNFSQEREDSIIAFLENSEVLSDEEGSEDFDDYIYLSLIE